MRKVDFVAVLEKLGASQEGVDAVNRASGKVTQIARAFAHPRGRGAPLKRQYFEWLVDQVSTTNNRLTHAEQLEVQRIVFAADPTLTSV